MVEEEKYSIFSLNFDVLVNKILVLTSNDWGTR
jgi:hypothetical protein